MSLPGWLEALLPGETAATYGETRLQFLQAGLERPERRLEPTVPVGGLRVAGLGDLLAMKRTASGSPGPPNRNRRAASRPGSSSERDRMSELPELATRVRFPPPALSGDEALRCVAGGRRPACREVSGA